MRKTFANLRLKANYLNFLDHKTFYSISNSERIVRTNLETEF